MQVVHDFWPVVDGDICLTAGDCQLPRLKSVDSKVYLPVDERRDIGGGETWARRV